MHQENLDASSATVTLIINVEIHLIGQLLHHSKTVTGVVLKLFKALIHVSVILLFIKYKSMKWLKRKVIISRLHQNECFSLLIFQNQVCLK